MWVLTLASYDVLKVFCDPRIHRERADLHFSAMRFSDNPDRTADGRDLLL